MEFIRPRKASLALDTAPLIDVVFQLLIFFMLSSSFTAPAFRLNLPQAVNRENERQERLVVSVDGKGNAFLNARAVSLDRLKGELEGMLASDTEKSVHFRGDEGISYGTFVQVMDSARQAGAKQINIVHERKEP